MTGTFGYGLDYFIDSPKQTATKRLGHKKFWNVAVHAVVSWGTAWGTLVIGQLFLPFWIQLLMILCKLAIVIVTEPPVGFGYSIMYSVVCYFALYVQSSGTLFGSAMLIALSFVIQIGSHLIFEGNLPPQKPPKGDGLVFQVLDMGNEFFFCEFHFGLLLFMRVGLLPVLQWRSDVELKKALDRTAEIKYGRKAA
ncbi:uncharacterized protein LOC116608994 isoform X1 [Nematostella vectensis]|uniref:uncharacterized protein LOC116608994 isoform X1 n=1 Tax=Nematostella vectensis TaxID=45351 RepID=UPI001390534B|nr:uncharacterized protein LOC116608994 isoform X1 [Nematostella vectensis]